MTAPAVRVRGLGKRFLAGEAVERHNTLRDAMADRFRRGTAWMRGGPKNDRRDRNVFWALRDVEFEVAQGEAVGIIGPNGAGKSTLLKILSRITPPTEGRVEIRGRVGCLLEVGTGFHSELTGRENTYLSGAILGMHRAEIDRKFDEIVDFAGVARFIDTPVKHYSSGMYLRLAFAVAAHLEPDILIVDEVLAVGDAEFQRKCLGKMEDVTRREGRTVLFVSHNMTAVERLCRRCILLRGGEVAAEGAPTAVIGQYLSSVGMDSRPGAWIELDGAERKTRGPVRFSGMRYCSETRDTENFPFTNGPFLLTVELDAREPCVVSGLGVSLRDMDGNRLVNADIGELKQHLHLERGRTRFEVRIDSLHLNPGLYSLGLWLSDANGAAFDQIFPAAEIEVVPPPGDMSREARSYAPVPCSFRVRKLPSDPAPGVLG